MREERRKENERRENTIIKKNSNIKNEWKW
jgi:hypothetical protein